MGTRCPDVFVCPIEMDDEPMEDPVFAADGHTYERRGIAQWLTNNDTSPLTKEVLRNRELTPNHHLKSQIEQWREEQKGEAARQKKLKDLLTQMQWCTTSDEVKATLSAFNETLVSAAQLKSVSVCSTVTSTFGGQAALEMVVARQIRPGDPCSRS